MSGVIPYGKQHITEGDIQEVIRVLKSDFLTQGPEIEAFEEAFASYVGAKYAVAVANGTAALHLCTLSLGVQPGQKVITTPITFAASANCVRYCGGEVVFADIDPETYLLDINEVRKLLEADTRKDIKGIIPVDFAGRSVDMEAFRALADEFGCWIIEDACHAPGAFFTNTKGLKVKTGSGQYADLAIFSFHPVKHIAAGEGGMITTNNKALYEKLMMLRTHGITKNQDEFQNSPEFAEGKPIKAYNEPFHTKDSADGQTANNQYPAWYMEMQDLGYNYRLTDFQAALGLSQLQRADLGLERRAAIANKYFEAFKGLSFIKGQSQAVEGHAYHLYIIEVEDRLGLYNHLREHGVYAQIHYIPCHLMPYYRERGWKEGDLKYAESYYASCISLPMYPTLTDEEQNFVIEAIVEFLKN